MSIDRSKGPPRCVTCGAVMSFGAQDARPAWQCPEHGWEFEDAMDPKAWAWLDEAETLHGGNVKMPEGF